MQINNLGEIDRRVTDELVELVVQKLRKGVLDYQAFKLAETEQRLHRLEFEVTTAIRTYIDERIAGAANAGTTKD